MNTPKTKNRFTTPVPPVRDYEPSLTQQHFKDDTEINSVVRKYMKGLPINMNTRPATFGDFSSQSFHEMHTKIADVQTQFNDLPVKLRSKFQNSPFNLLRWLENPANAETAVKLGLVAPEASEYDPDAILQSHAQLDLEREAERLQAFKSDPEANPGFQKPGSVTDAGNAGKPA